MDETPKSGAGLEPPSGEHRIDLEVEPAEAQTAVAGAAEAWGADWQSGINGGSLHLPIAAGIRRGAVQGEVRIEPGPLGSRVRFVPGEAVYYVQTPAVVLLLMAAAGGVMTILWPFMPGLLPLAPLGALIALSGWFLVVSRLTINTPDDFLRLVREISQEDGEDDGEDGGEDGGNGGGGESAQREPDR